MSESGYQVFNFSHIFKLIAHILYLQNSNFEAIAHSTIFPQHSTEKKINYKASQGLDYEEGSDLMTEYHLLVSHVQLLVLQKSFS